MNEKQLNNKKVNIIPSFKYGGTTSEWQNNADEIMKYLENKMENNTDNDLNKKHYYMKDQN